MLSETGTWKIRRYCAAEWFVTQPIFSFPMIGKIMIPILNDFQYSSLDNITFMLIIWPNAIKSEDPKSYINIFHWSEGWSYLTRLFKSAWQPIYLEYLSLEDLKALYKTLVRHISSLLQMVGSKGTLHFNENFPMEKRLYSELHMLECSCP